MYKTVNTLIDQLKSNGVKERQAAIASLRTTLDRDAVIDELDNSPKRLGWLALFQALFTAVLNEKSIATHGSKSASAAKKRVAEGASTVRWLTERSVHQLTHKNVIKALLNHLVQTSSYQGKLFLPVALDYAKAIRCVLDYPPHLEHIDDEMWVKLAEMCLNVVLGDSLRKKLVQEEDDEIEETREMDLTPEGDEDDDDDDDSVTSHETKKRRRREESGTPEPSIMPRGVIPRTQPRPVSVEQIGFASLLSLLLTSSAAPFLATEYPHLGSAMLNRLLRFLRLYPSDTSLHPDFIIIVSATLSHLALNERDTVTWFAQRAWDALLGMWGTKNKTMKENLIIVLRILFPFYTTRYPEASSALDSSYVDGVSRLWSLLDGEAESRWGVDGLSLDSLRLSLMRDCPLSASKPGAFMARTFQYGWNFDSNQAVSWAILELQADCAEKVRQFCLLPPALQC
jgi:ataxia telangiectasia mutated family protein